MRTPALLAGLAVLAALSWAGEPAAPVVRQAAAVDWKASGSLPPGAEYHLVYEDPRTHGVQALVRMPNGYSLPPHSHSADETILVLKGKLVLGFGGKEQTLTAGGFAVIPGGTVFTLESAGFGGAQFFSSFNGPYDSKPAPK